MQPGNNISSISVCVSRESVCESQCLVCLVLFTMVSTVYTVGGYGEGISTRHRWLHNLRIAAPPS
jgi:hypothetical protein